MCKHTIIPGRKHWIYALFLTALMLGGLTSCRKNRWKKPTEVGTMMDINRSYSSGGDLVFSSGYIRLASFDVEGRREQGDDIYFVREWNTGTVINFDQSAFVAALDYDIPQGDYNFLEIEFETFDDNGDITILVEGTYTDLSSTDIPVRFEFRDSESFAIVAEDDGGGSSIVLDKDVASVLAIQLDPVHWFSTVGTSLMENATLTNLSGTMTMLITDSINEDIYDIVVDRLDESAEATL